MPKGAKDRELGLEGEALLRQQRRFNMYLSFLNKINGDGLTGEEEKLALEAGVFDEEEENDLTRDEVNRLRRENLIKELIKIGKPRYTKDVEKNDMNTRRQEITDIFFGGSKEENKEENENEETEENEKKKDDKLFICPPGENQPYLFQKNSRGDFTVSKEPLATHAAYAAYYRPKVPKPPKGFFSGLWNRISLKVLGRPTKEFRKYAMEMARYQAYMANETSYGEDVVGTLNREDVFAERKDLEDRFGTKETEQERRMRELQNRPKTDVLTRARGNMWSCCEKRDFWSGDIEKKDYMAKLFWRQIWDRLTPDDGAVLELLANKRNTQDEEDGITARIWRNDDGALDIDGALEDLRATAKRLAKYPKEERYDNAETLINKHFEAFKNKSLAKEKAEYDTVNGEAFKEELEKAQKKWDVEYKAAKRPNGDYVSNNVSKAAAKALSKLENRKNAAEENYEEKSKRLNEFKNELLYNYALNQDDRESIARFSESQMGELFEKYCQLHREHEDALDPKKTTDGKLKEIYVNMEAADKEKKKYAGDYHYSWSTGGYNSIERNHHYAMQKQTSKAYSELKDARDKRIKELEESRDLRLSQMLKSYAVSHRVSPYTTAEEAAAKRKSRDISEVNRSAEVPREEDKMLDMKRLVVKDNAESKKNDLVALAEQKIKNNQYFKMLASNEKRDEFIGILQEMNEKKNSKALLDSVLNVWSEEDQYHLYMQYLMKPAAVEAVLRNPSLQAVVAAEEKSYKEVKKEVSKLGQTMDQGLESTDVQESNSEVSVTRKRPTLNL